MGRILAFKVTRALAARLLFAAHSLMSIWRLYVDTRFMYYWALAAAPILLFVEAAVTILLRHGDEYKWFCPSVFLFLCGSVPPIWLLELRSTLRKIQNSTATDDTVDPLDFASWLMTRQVWMQVIEQSLLVILILGRWMLPKGRITRDELSQLLLAYLAISSDIVELFNLFNEDKVRQSLNLSLVVLAVWSVSLVQFPFVITTVKAQKARYCFSLNTNSVTLMDGDNRSLTPVSHAKFGGSETGKVVVETRRTILLTKIKDVRAWGILSTVFLQDLPFWLVRIYLIFAEDVMSYTMFFFVCKNSLIIWIQLYRLVVICCERQAMPDDGKQLQLLQPEHYSPFATPEKARLLDNGNASVSGSADERQSNKSEQKRQKKLQKKKLKQQKQQQKQDDAEERNSRKHRQQNGDATRDDPNHTRSTSVASGAPTSKNATPARKTPSVQQQQQQLLLPQQLQQSPQVPRQLQQQQQPQVPPQLQQQQQQPQVPPQLQQQQPQVPSQLQQQQQPQQWLQPPEQLRPSPHHHAPAPPPPQQQQHQQQHQQQQTGPLRIVGTVDARDLLHKQSPAKKKVKRTKSDSQSPPPPPIVVKSPAATRLVQIDDL